VSARERVNLVGRASRNPPGIGAPTQLAIGGRIEGNDVFVESSQNWERRLCQRSGSIGMDAERVKEREVPEAGGRGAKAGRAGCREKIGEAS